MSHHLTAFMLRAAAVSPRLLPTCKYRLCISFSSALLRTRLRCKTFKVWKQTAAERQQGTAGWAAAIASSTLSLSLSLAEEMSHRSAPSWQDLDVCRSLRRGGQTTADPVHLTHKHFDTVSSGKTLRSITNKSLCCLPSGELDLINFINCTYSSCFAHV